LDHCWQKGDGVPGLRLTDPVYLRIKEIIYSPDGRAAVLAATAKGEPALAGVDPLLKAALGTDYKRDDLGTASAGDLVAKLMRGLGYKAHKTKRCGPECVARTALTWLPNGG
jgi:hypothetical protein